MKSRQQFHNINAQLEIIEDAVKTATGTTSYVLKGPYKGHALPIQFRFKSTEKKSAVELAMQAYHACRFLGITCDLDGHVLSVDPLSASAAA